MDIATNGDILTYEVTENTNSPLVTTTIPTNQETAPIELTLHYQPDKNGFADITVLATDKGGLVAEQTFKVTVTAVNDEPSFTVSDPNQSVPEDSGTSGTHTVSGWATNISVGPANEIGQFNSVGFGFSVTVNSNSSLFTTNGQPAVSDTGTLTYTVVANAFGTASVTVELIDGGGTANIGDDDTSAPKPFTIEVTAVNDEPSFTVSDPNQSVAEDSGTLGTHTVSGWATNISVGPANESGQFNSVGFGFSVTVNSNSSLFTTNGQPAVSDTGTLTYTVVANAFGTASVTVELIDGGGTANVGDDDTSAPRPFTIEVKIDEDFSGSLSSDLQDADSAYTLAGGTISKTIFNNGSDRHYIRTVATDFNTVDFVAELTFTTTAGQGTMIHYFGLGPGIQGIDFNESPGVTFRIHSSDTVGGRVDAGVRFPVGTFTGTLGIGNITTSGGTHRAQITKSGNQVDFAIDVDFNGTFTPDITSQIADLAAAAPFLNNTNSRIFFGTASATDVFDDLLITVTP